MSKIRVLHIVQSLATGGLENGIINLVNHSNPDDFIVDVLCLRDKGELTERINNPNTRIFFDGNHQQSKLTAIKKVYQHCQSHSYDILHSHGYATMLAAYIGGKLASCPTIINGEHGTLYYSSKKEVLIQRFLFNRMQLNLSVSSVLKNEICTLFSVSSERFKTIINGVDTIKFSPNKNQQRLKKQLGIGPDQLIIGSVGRLVPLKNYPSLIRAISLMVKQFPQLMLLLAGDGPEKESLEKLIVKLNLTEHIRLLGQREDIADLMNLYDIFVLPSRCEGLSNTLLEAMSCGTPVLAADVGGNGEIIAEGTSGYLYPTDDSDALAKHLTCLLLNTSLREDLGRQARKHIEDNFSLETMVNNYENTYQELLLTRVSH